MVNIRRGRPKNSGILNKNARIPSKEIANELRNAGVDASDRTIRKRIGRLEKIPHPE